MTDNSLTFRSRIQLQIAAGWTVKDSFTLTDPSRGANVIVSSEASANANQSLEQYADEQQRLLSDEFPDFVQDSVDEIVAFSGNRAIIRLFRWSPLGGGPVSQMQMYCLSGGRTYTATATTSIDSVLDYQSILIDILAGIQLVNPTPP